MSNLTFGIIKPDAVSAGHTGSIIQKNSRQRFQDPWTKVDPHDEEAGGGFLRGASRAPVLSRLTEFMSSGPCVVMALEKEGAVKAWRDLMGATDPAKADAGTLRKEFGGSVGENAVHGSDSDENAAIEIAYFFSRLELV